MQPDVVFVVWLSQLVLLAGIAVLARAGLQRSEKLSGPRINFTTKGVLIQIANAFGVGLMTIVYALSLPQRGFQGAEWLIERFDLSGESVLQHTEWYGAAQTWFAVVLCLWALRTIGQAGAYSGLEVRERHRLCDTGPLAYVRHPMYAALIPMYVGMCLALQSAFPLVHGSVLFVTIFPKFAMEEDALLAQLGDQYRDYMRRVPARIIPGLY